MFSLVDVVHKSADLAVAQFCFRLPLKLRFGQFDRDDSRNPLPDILAGESGFIFFDQFILFA